MSIQPATALTDAPVTFSALAEQLRDGPLQSLIDIQMQAAGLAARLADDPASPQCCVSSPMPAGTRTSLLSRLLELCEDFRAETGIRCEVAIAERHTRFADEVNEVIYRTVRELLTNVRQHAHAKHVMVSSLGRRDGSIGICVADDGVGLPAHRRRGNPFDESGGIGLWSIDQRLREFDAMLDIEAAAGRGTRAMVILPGSLVITD